MWTGVPGSLLRRGQQQGIQIGFCLFENRTETAITVAPRAIEAAAKLRNFVAFHPLQDSGVATLAVTFPVHPALSRGAESTPDQGRSRSSRLAVFHIRSLPS